MTLSLPCGVGSAPPSMDFPMAHRVDKWLTGVKADEDKRPGRDELPTEFGRRLIRSSRPHPAKQSPPAQQRRRSVCLARPCIDS